MGPRAGLDGRKISSPPGTYKFVLKKEMPTAILRDNSTSEVSATNCKNGIPLKALAGTMISSTNCGEEICQS